MSTTLNEETDGKETKDAEEEEGMAADDDTDTDPHAKPPHWIGWSEAEGRSFGLEMQRPWSRLLLKGSKKIETRRYDLPPSLLGRRIDILESRPGLDGVSELGDALTAWAGTGGHGGGGEGGSGELVTVPGWCIFTNVVRYVDRDSFEKDEGLHLVDKESGYGWNGGDGDGSSTKIIYGWVVVERGWYSTDVDDGAQHGPTRERRKESSVISILRRFRSLYEIERVSD